jgi:hypothetical protein
MANVELDMSMEMFVLSDRELSSIAEWQAAIDAKGFPLKMDDTNLKAHSGFLPARLNGKLTGFECDHFPAAEFMSETPEVDFGHDWMFVLAFRWIGNFKEMTAAWMAAAAYAAATEGVVLDDQEPKIRTAAEATEEARYLEEKYA